MEKMKFETPDLAADNVAKIGALFPNCITETVDANGKPKRAVNFDLLRQMLSGEVVDGREAYEFSWVGKRAAIAEANQPIRKTLRPCKAESKNWDTTQNLYIEGDNLQVLKLLQESYLGKVKMIYIDPPYNTGNDFIYADNFARTKEEENAQLGMYDDEGNHLVVNSASNGRFHSDWCSMMYSRLMLARNLLADDGVIFISINDCEIENLKKICNEIFSEINMVGCFCWKTDGNFDNQAKIKSCHEYILAYAKNEVLFPAPPVIDPNVPQSSKLYREEIRNTIIKNGFKNPPCAVKIPKGFPSDIEKCEISAQNVNWPRYDGDILINDYCVQNDVTATSGWSSNAQLLEFIDNGFLPVVDSKGQETRFVLTRTGAIEAIKKRGQPSHVVSVLENMGGTQKAAVDLGALAKYFDYPKPVTLLKYLCSMFYVDDETIVLDFFSGSATTAHAVMQLNAEDGGHRKFIMVQLPEPCDEKSEAYKAGYKNICEIGKERIRRAGEKIKAESPLTTQQLDVGFRVLKLADSNMEDVYYAADEYSQQSLLDMVSNIKPDRTDLDLLFGCLLDWGIELSMPYYSETIQGCTVHTYNDGDLIACFDANIPESVIRTIAQREDVVRVVFRDSCFANSPDKINVFEIFKLYKPEWAGEITNHVRVI